MDQMESRHQVEAQRAAVAAGTGCRSSRPGRRCPAAGRPCADSLSMIASQWERMGALAVATGRLTRHLLGPAGGGTSGPDRQGRRPPRRAAGIEPRPAAHPDAPAGVVLDHRALARYAVCPFQGWAVEFALVASASPAAEAGGEVHRLLAEAVRQYVEQGVCPARCLEADMVNSRPDVQHEVVDALRRSTGAIDRFLAAIPPGDILAYRGGRGPRSGRLWGQILPATPDRPAILGSSQFDLLYAGASDGEACEVDFKSGRRIWTATDVRQSFQFRMHAWLVLANLPHVELHHVRVWNTRANVLTPAVSFCESEAASGGALARAAAERRQAALDTLGRDGEGDQSGRVARAYQRRAEQLWWPGLEKCACCPACLKCPAALAPAKDFSGDPERYVRDTAAMKAALAARMQTLRAAVRQAGKDFVFSDVAFGIDKPAPARNAAADFYTPIARPRP